MTSIRILLSALLLLGGVAGPAHAHKDRMLTRNADGSIPEVPAHLGKVTLDIEGLETGKALVRLTVGANRTTLPACLTRMIRTRNSNDIRLAGSWYHVEKPDLPFYINVEFVDPGQNLGAPYVSSQRFLFSLRDAKLIHYGGFTADKSGWGGQGYKLKVPAGCAAKYEVVRAEP